MDDGGLDRSSERLGWTTAVLAGAVADALDDPRVLMAETELIECVLLEALFRCTLKPGVGTVPAAGCRTSIGPDPSGRSLTLLMSQLDATAGV